ncbi:MAG: DUF2007 domain-containing protein [Thermoanaerobaculia bacterium]|nr:DUF2007 domain-containing protein [Thermoanaerobaculia bacterium]
MSDEWVTVRTLGTEEEAAIVAGFLENEGIRAVVESRRFHQEPANFGQLGLVEVKVPADEAAGARRLLDEREARPSDS